MLDKHTDEHCDVCGAFLRAQGGYRYCPKQGTVGHIMAAKALRDGMLGEDNDE